MASPLIINIVGYAAAICMICGYLPQAIYTIRTRDTDGIALPTFLLLGFGSIFFVIQGILLFNWPLMITNTITTVSSAIVFAIKIHNDRMKRENSTPLKRASGPPFRYKFILIYP